MEENSFDLTFNRIKPFLAGMGDSFESDEIKTVKWGADDVHVFWFTSKELDGNFLKFITSVDP